MPTWRVQLWHNNIPWGNSGFTRALLLPLFLLWAFTIWLIGKDPDAGKVWRREEKGTTEDDMVGWHHWLDGHEFEQALGVGDGQGSLVCCGSWVCTVGHDWATELTESSPFVEGLCYSFFFFFFKVILGSINSSSIWFQGFRVFERETFGSQYLRYVLNSGVLFLAVFFSSFL